MKHSLQPNMLQRSWKILWVIRGPSTNSITGFRIGMMLCLKVVLVSGIPHLDGNSGEKKTENARAALLFGPPGIGKTSTASVCCRLAGYDTIELNASDKRNMSSVRDILKDSVSTL